MIKLILFDLGGVLFTSGMNTFVDGVCRRYGIADKTLRELVDYGELGSLYREGKITRDEFWKRVISTLNLKETADELEREWIEGYHLIEGTKNLIEKLSKSYKVMFLSDNVKEREIALEKKYGFKSWFAGGIFSHEVGVRKPDPKVYKIALEKAEEDAEETVFIDDKESSLIPARKMGMTTILFESPEKLEKDLQTLGVLS
jgi:HAD superfamily hydrolase (TIGR01509 family)